MKQNKKVIQKIKKAKDIPERWYEIFNMGGALPQDFSETDNINVLRIPGHYFLKFQEDEKYGYQDGVVRKITSRTFGDPR